VKKAIKSCKRNAAVVPLKDLISRSIQEETALLKLHDLFSPQGFFPEEVEGGSQEESEEGSLPEAAVVSAIGCFNELAIALNTSICVRVKKHNIVGYKDVPLSYLNCGWIAMIYWTVVHSSIVGEVASLSNCFLGYVYWHFISSFALPAFKRGWIELSGVSLGDDFTIKEQHAAKRLADIEEDIGEEGAVKLQRIKDVLSEDAKCLDLEEDAQQEAVLGNSGRSY